jgi:two-component system, OmpR family, response regulator PrrA
MVLVVDDDAHIRQALERALRLEGFAVSTAVGGGEALEAIEQTPPAVIVLDVTMPDPDGVAVTRRLRGQGNDVPICILSARNGVGDRVAGLQAGADDYLVKPFAMEELIARLQALIRRRPEHAGAVARTVGAVRVDPSARQAWIDDVELELTGREFDLLDTLAQHPGMVLSREQLLEQVWGYTFDVQTNVVDVFVGYLRRKLEADGRERVLKTVRGQGFVLRA